MKNTQSVVIDRVAWTASWPKPAGRSLALRASGMNNDDPANWEAARPGRNIRA